MFGAIHEITTFRHMKSLILQRHAKSSWDHPDLNDFDRPLNQRGLRDALEMGKRMGRKGERPDLYVSSPANRAITTARIIGKELKYPLEKIVLNQAIYMAGVRTLLTIVNTLDDDNNTVILFGHNPGFTEFAEYLSDERFGNVPTSGQVKITFEAESWALISAGLGIVEWFDFPKNTLK